MYPRISMNLLLISGFLTCILYHDLGNCFDSSITLLPNVSIVSPSPNYHVFEIKPHKVTPVEPMVILEDGDLDIPKSEFPDVDVQVFSNGTGAAKLGAYTEHEDPYQHKPYRKRYEGGTNKRHGNGGYGVTTFVATSATGHGGSHGNAHGWHKGGGKNHHYNPSVNKYGGGGPINFQPTNNKGRVPSFGGGSGSGTGGSAGSNEVESGVGVVVVVEEASNTVTCDASDKCQKFTQCASYSYDYLRSKDRSCLFTQLTKGLCCDATYPDDNPGSGKHFPHYSTDRIPVPDISLNSLKTAALKGYEYQAKYRGIENQLLELNIVVEKGTAAYKHLQFFQTTPANLHRARDNFLVIKATNYIQDTYFLTPDEAGIGLQGYDFGGTIFEKTCPVVPNCAHYSKYRTADGSCNNPSSPKLGQSSTTLIRLLPPDFADGVWAPRVRRDGGSLPNARYITLNLVPDANIPDPRYSHILMQYGQFVDHDLSHVPIYRYGDMSGIQCCSDIESDVSHPACFPIAIPDNDPYLRRQPCMNFVRSLLAPRLDCTFGHADQLNQLTHWLDASQIYGSTFEQAESLREFSGGRLRVSRDSHGKDLLPDDQQHCASRSGGGGNCFVAGDKRVNEQTGLTSMHTIFLREHNRVASELERLNPHWEDEIIYQESRRIVVAENQHIIYNEWLPIIIGRNYMRTFGILPYDHSYYQGYDQNVDSSISNAFTTAAFRFGHTLVQGTFNLQGNGGTSVGKFSLRDFFLNPHLLRQPGFIDYLTKGLVTQPIQRFDNFVTTELRDHLFESSNQGMDLIALNIQRGRDHGLPGYNEYRDLCRLGKARDFSDLSPIIHPRKASNLERIYGSVDDIDLFIGGIHETPLEGALVGPTFACIIGDQFVRLKKGDRYFHDIGGQPHSFTKVQLHEIRSASLSRILCDNSDEGFLSVQPLAFHLPHPGFNPTIPCGSPSIPRIDLRAWKQ